MLYNWAYLDESALDRYVSSLEGGLRRGTTSKTAGGSGIGGEVNVHFAKGDGTKSSSHESTIEAEDTSASRFDRLLSAAKDVPDKLDWIDVAQPALEFKDLQTGQMVAWECDIYIPESIQAFSKQGGMMDALKMMRNFTDVAEPLDLDMGGLPDQDQLTAVAKFLESTDVAPVIVGEDDDTNWRVAGSLIPEFIAASASLEDRARIVGKVTRVIRDGQWWPMGSLPGMNLMNREQKRKAQREGPKSDKDKNMFLEGPAVILDYLAIYR